MLYNIGSYTTPPRCANVLTQSSLLPVYTIRSASELGVVGVDLGTACVLLQQEVWLPSDCSSGCAPWTCPLLLVCAIYLSQQGPWLSLQRYASSCAPLHYFSFNLRIVPSALTHCDREAGNVAGKIAAVGQCHAAGLAEAATGHACAPSCALIRRDQ